MKERNFWTPEEVEILKRLEIPSTKTRKQAQSKAYEMGFRLPRIVNEDWTDEEIKILKSNKFPPNRSKKAAYVKANTRKSHSTSSSMTSRTTSHTLTGSMPTGAGERAKRRLLQAVRTARRADGRRVSLARRRKRNDGSNQ